MKVALDTGSVVEFDKRSEPLQIKDGELEAVVYDTGDKDALYNDPATVRW